MFKKLNDMRKNKKGFTLVELIVVLVILGILIALLVPALTGYIDRAHQREAQAQAKMVITAAQTLANEEYEEKGGASTSFVLYNKTLASTDTTDTDWDKDITASDSLNSLSECTGKYVKGSTITLDGAKVTSLEYKCSNGWTAKYTIDGTNPSGKWVMSKTTS